MGRRNHIIRLRFKKVSKESDQYYQIEHTTFDDNFEPSDLFNVTLVDKKTMLSTKRKLKKGL